MKWIVVALLVVLAIASFVFAAIAGSDPEGRGGSYALAGLAGCVACIAGAIWVAAAA